MISVERMAERLESRLQLHPTCVPLGQTLGDGWRPGDLPPKWDSGPQAKMITSSIRQICKECAMYNVCTSKEGHGVAAGAAPPRPPFKVIQNYFSDFLNHSIFKFDKKFRNSEHCYSIKFSSGPPGRGTPFPTSNFWCQGDHPSSLPPPPTNLPLVPKR